MKKAKYEANLTPKEIVIGVRILMKTLKKKKRRKIILPPGHSTPEEIIEVLKIPKKEQDQVDRILKKVLKRKRKE